MKSYKTLMLNLFYQVEQTINVVRESILKCLAIFLVYSITTLAIGVGIIISFKLFFKFV